ncbi:MAG: AAA family ATPase [Candidatus Omnitrophica bacterium]|jgi:chromosome segregation protein|nr:AAA family ATPase [Candidatus Omnitrophota bacterium]
MFLKELEIFGFKSFPEKVSLKFEPGITVIVGPNGCGKSNVLDSLKWSLGEQSPKSLRGSKMEDIIFNGTENHPALNYAEVTLTFANEDKYLPIEYKEVAITRRLYRSGESEYLINKNPVRLKDIEALFMGTGIGEATYSFIEQGKIEVFLSYKPEDKRLIFDEASGIVKYKESRRETLKKLEETDENLVRLDDIISEVKRQIRYLERQVEKTRKFKECQEHLVEIEKKIGILKFKGLEEKINVILEELNSLKEKENSKDNELKENKTKWEELNLRLRDMRKELAAASSQVFSFSAQIETSLSYINVSKQRIIEVDERNNAIEQSKRTFSERITLQDSRIEEEKNKLIRIEQEVSSINAQIEKLKEEKTSLLGAIEEAKKKIEEEKIRIFELESKGVNIRNGLIELQTQVSSLANRKKRLSLDKARIENLSSERKATKEELSVELADLDSKLSGLRGIKSSLVLKEQALASTKESLQAKIIEKEKKLVELNSYYDFLKDLRTKYDTFSASKKITIVFDEEPKDVKKLIISLKGAQFTKEGNAYKAVIEAKVISLEEDELKEKMDVIRAEIETLKQELENTENQKKQVSEQSLAQNSQVEEEEKRYQGLFQEKETLNRDLARFNEEFELVEKELEANRQELESRETKQKELEAEIATCEESLNVSKTSMAGFHEIVLSSSKRINEIDVDSAKSETHRQSLSREKESLNSRVLLFCEEKENILKNLADMDKEKSENIQKSETLLQEIQKIELVISSDKEKINVYSQKKDELEKEENGLLAKIEEDRKLLEVAEGNLEELRSAVYNKKLETQSLDYEKEKIKDYLRQVYTVEFNADWVAAPLEEGSSLDKFNEDKESLKKKLESLGDVNLVAIEEFDELKKREEFLDNQKNDLVTSKENLKKAIQKINKTSRELFLETFAKIEEEFKNNFRFLFGGGRAQLILLDQDDVLESGVEIEVQPPGKKTQNVALLSGGEKALTTIALIFAIFKVRPSPICVLDEIDAPLDESNVDRFNHILKQFSANSQFIVITHNKKTMSRADILYGVTMQEKGVSKLVSVKFATNGQGSQAIPTDAPEKEQTQAPA